MSLFRRKKDAAEKPSFIDALPFEVKANVIDDLDEMIHLGKRFYSRLTPAQWSGVIDELGPTMATVTSQVVRGMMTGSNPVDTIQKALQTAKLPVFINELVIRATLAMRDEE